MKKRTWQVNLIETWSAGDGTHRYTFRAVDLESKNAWKFYDDEAQVWWDQDRMKGMCTSCTTPSGNGSSNSCRHVEAVRRHTKLHPPCQPSKPAVTT